VARDGEYLRTAEHPLPPASMTSSMHVHDFVLPDLEVPAEPGRSIRVIDIVPRQIVTKSAIDTPLIADGNVVSDTGRDILKLVVIERHKATGNIGRGFVRGFGLKSGALASTVAHDAHNIIIVGTNDIDMYIAALELIRLDGGQCVVGNGHVIEELALPIAGLVSDRPLPEVRARVDALIAAAARMGCTLPDPFMTLSFLALSPIPALKVTDLGLVDSERFEITDLFV
jgi:adenine deaminase